MNASIDFSVFTFDEKWGLPRRPQYYTGEQARGRVTVGLARLVRFTSARSRSEA